MIEGILIGLKTALSFQNLMMVMIGCFAGTIIGMLPGLGPMTAIALMIPITYGFDPATGLILMAGVYYGAVFGGSTSSILINAPGVPGTVATSFDGYPMAQQGKAGKALAIAAYNAGEHRVDRWIKDSSGTPIDIWIESIPFKETRNYVKNVLAFNVVYSNLLGTPVDILQESEKLLQPR